VITYALGKKLINMEGEDCYNNEADDDGSFASKYTQPEMRA
jgi:hypothetical protein